MFIAGFWGKYVDDTVKVASKEKNDKYNKRDIPNLM